MGGGVGMGFYLLELHPTKSNMNNSICLGFTRGSIFRLTNMFNNLNCCTLLSHMLEEAFLVLHLSGKPIKRASILIPPEPRICLKFSDEIPFSAIFSHLINRRIAKVQMEIKQPFVFAHPKSVAFSFL